MQILKKYKFIIFISLVLFIILVFIYYANRKESVLITNEQDLEIVTSNDTKLELKKIKVDIKGAIKKPGVYEVLEGSRVVDVIGISGGVNYNAYTSNINLSKILKDEDVIIIYTKEEIENFKSQNLTIKYVEKECPAIESFDKECDCSVIKNVACIEKENIVTNSDAITKENKLINLNLASKEELMTLSGIGESKANLIIEYREKNKFKSIEELKNIKGIGNSIYENIKEFIEV